MSTNKNKKTGIRLGIGDRLRDGRQLLRAAYKESDVKKLGNLRAGNSGILSEVNNVAGSCHRIAHLRQLGLEVDPPEDHQLVMFQVGTANEDIVYKDLTQTAVPGEVILREEEIPTTWKTANGTLVTGRPDMVICHETIAADEKRGVDRTLIPVLGLELKSIASVWTTRSVLFEGKPKIAHLTQAGHYMWQLAVPFRLIYKQYALQAMPDFAHKLIPAKGEPGSEYVEYGDKDRPKAIKPFEIVYELRFGDDGLLQYRREPSESPASMHARIGSGPGAELGGGWETTVVSTEDIRRYYEFVSEMASRKLLGNRPLTIKPSGELERWSNCSYCPLNDICAGADPDKKNPNKKLITYTKWLSLVKKRLTEVNR